MTLNLGPAQLIMTALLLLGMGISLAKYGERKNDRYDLIDVLVSPCLMFALLWWGGFYSIN